MKVLVGSTNPVKVEATEEAFLKYFKDVDVVSIAVDSKVPKQPINEQTFIGAENRAKELKRINDSKKLNADYFVGIEGGIVKIQSKWFDFGAICIIDKKGRMGMGSSPHFELPEKVTKKLLEEGKELGEVADELSNDKNVKQKGGAVGFLSRNVMKRKELYISGIIVAIIPFLNESLYFKA